MKLLSKGRSITSMDAFTRFGATRLSAIIFDIRKAGHDVRNNWVTRKNAFGKKVTYSAYYLVRPQ